MEPSGSPQRLNCMKIVFLDAFTLGSDLDTSPLHTLGDCTLYDRTSPDQLVERAQGAEVVLTNKCVLTAEVMDQLPELKYIGVTATGYNIVDVAAAKARGIVVTNVRDYSTAAVAQLVFAHILQFTNELAYYNSADAWVSSPDWCYYHHGLSELAGKTLGIVGLGTIGKQVARIAHAFDMRVVTLPSPRPRPEGIETLSSADFWPACDFISLHCPLTPETQHLIRAEVLQQCKPTAILVNTARGGLILEEDLAHALQVGWIAGAALDVLTVEPPSADHPLLSAPHCRLSPHIGWASVEARQRLLKQVVLNIQAYQAGSPIQTVS